MRVFLVAATLVTGLISSCASDAEKGNGSKEVVNIDIVDTEGPFGIFRHIEWDGEGYSPSVFKVRVAKTANRIVISTDTAEALRCGAALSNELKIPVQTFVDDNLKSVEPSNESVDIACTIEEPILPKPPLREGYFYISLDGKIIVLDEINRMNLQSFRESVRNSDIKGLVMRKPSIGELLCISALAAESKLKLMNLKKDGSLSPLEVKGASVSICFH